jgi:hypothetical protein
MTNREVVMSFFASYQRHDAAGMHSCLDPQVEFSDLAFRKITGANVRAMWQWFCVPTESRTKPVSVPSFEVLKAEGDCVQARYEVDYTLEGGHAVSYVIHSDFTLSNGKIVGQVDKPTISNFQFAKMALGYPKCILGLTPMFKPIIRREMGSKLAEFRKNAERKGAAAGRP